MINLYNATLRALVLKSNIKKNATVLTNEVRRVIGETYKGRKFKCSRTKTRYLLKKLNAISW